MNHALHSKYLIENKNMPRTGCFIDKYVCSFVKFAIDEINHNPKIISILSLFLQLLRLVVNMCWNKKKNFQTIIMHTEKKIVCLDIEI